jgi:hypothetical protein
VLWSIALGLLSTAVWALGATGRVRLSAWLMIAGQVPYSAWDVLSRNYGFLILTPVSVLAGVFVLKQRNNVTSNNEGALPSRVFRRR